MTDQKEFTPIIDVTEIPELTSQIFDQKFAKLEKDIADQRKLSWGLVVGVGLAFLFTIGLIAVDMFKFHSSKSEIYAKKFGEYQSQLSSVEAKLEVVLLKQSSQAPEIFLTDNTVIQGDTSTVVMKHPTSPNVTLDKESKKVTENGTQEK